MLKISAIINTNNAAKYLTNCLNSLSFANEIIVVDMESTDNTIAIANKFHAKVITIPKATHVELVRNLSIKNASHPWILLVDPDESLPVTLQQQIAAVLSEKAGGIVAYQIARKNMVFGKWIEHSGWWPDYQIRLFQKDKVRWSGVIHQQPEVDGEMVVLSQLSQSAILHDNYRTLDEYFEKMIRYTQAEVSAPTWKNAKKITSDQLLKSFFDDFVRRYYKNNGHKDGLHGTALALLQSYYQVITNLRAWELQAFSQSSHPISSTAINQVIRDWKYWQATEMLQQTKGWQKYYWLLRKKFRF